jgi:formylglycine-generating enzyme required for sulfatase activity
MAELTLRKEFRQARYFTESLTDELGLDMILVEGGEFEMGSPKNEHERRYNEGPQHWVTVPTFFMGRYPVTQAQWRLVAGLPRLQQNLNPVPSYFKGETRPVETVSWHDAVEFCARLSAKTRRDYRLPSEAEWEYACRAGTETPFYFGQLLAPEVATYDRTYTYNSPKDEFRGETTPVDYFGLANAWGLSDMHGNVWEWCHDHYHNSYEGAPTDGRAWLSGNLSENRVLRGGSLGFTPKDCRSASRSHGNQRDSHNYIGFRVVCQAPKILT